MRELFQIHSQNPCQNVHSVSDDGSLVAIVVKDKVVLKTQRGKQFDEVNVESNDIFTTKFNSRGTLLIVAYKNRNHITLWKKADQGGIIDVGFKDPSLIIWSPTEDIFCMGTENGNLVIYNVANEKLDKILRKHSDEITCGIWTCENMLVLGSKDKTISLSSGDGQTIKIMSLGAYSFPREITYAHVDQCHMIVAAVDPGICFLDTSTLQMNVVDLHDDIGYVGCLFALPDCRSIIIATTKGIFASVTNPLLDQNEDNYYKRLRLYSGHINFISCCTETQSFLMTNEENICIFQYRDGMVHEHLTLPIESAKCIKSSQNGEVVLVNTLKVAYVFQSNAPSLTCSHKDKVAFMSTLGKVTVVDHLQEKLLTISIQPESDIIGLGPSHLVVGCGNSVYVYEYKTQNDNIKSQIITLNKEAKKLYLNENYLAIHTDEALQIYRLQVDTEYLSTYSPNDNNKLSCAVMTADFFIYGTYDGVIYFLHIDTTNYLHEISIKHHSSIICISSSEEGSVIAFVDVEGHGFLYDTFNQEVLSISSFPKCQQLMWDQAYNNVFYVFDGYSMHCFVVYLRCIRGFQVTKMSDNVSIEENGEVHILKQQESYQLPPYHTPIFCQKGEITCWSQRNGQLVTFPSDAFTLEFNQDIDKMEMKNVFSKLLVLDLLDEALLFAKSINSPVLWKALGNKALEMMNISMAIIAFQELREVSIVAKLEDLELIEEKNLLSGHLATLFGDFDLAETKFLNSSKPFEALNLRCNFGHWNEALVLATECFPKRIKDVSISLATELELAGDVKSAMEVLEQALVTQEQTECDDFKLHSEIAKLSLRLGNFKKCYGIAEKLASPSLFTELAAILEEQNQVETAVKFYELGENIPKAMHLWMKLKNVEKISQLLVTCQTPMDKEFYNEFGVLCRNTGKFEKSIQAFKSAENPEAAIQVCLTNLKDATRAKAIMKKLPCVSCALEASEFCKKQNDYTSAIEFLVLGNFYDEAFQIAISTNNVNFFIYIVGKSIPSGLAEQIGDFYITKGDANIAAQYFSCSPRTIEKALSIYVKHGQMKEAMELTKTNKELKKHMISVILSIKADTLEKKHHLLQLYLDIKEWSRSLETGQTIITEILNTGDYSKAYGIASNIIIRLSKERVPLTPYFRFQFNLLHSYRLAKKFLQKADHVSAAPLLIRISENIDIFPKKDHLNLLISTVVECDKCDMSQSAMKFSKAICANKELKAQLDKTTFRRKIESILRRTQQAETTEDELDKSYFSHPINTVLPLCICSGKFMTPQSDIWTFCPISSLPAIYSGYMKFHSLFGTDPLCDRPLDANEIRNATPEDVEEYIHYCCNEFD